MTTTKRKRKHSKAVCSIDGCKNERAQKRTTKTAYICQVCRSKRANENVLGKFQLSNMMLTICNDVRRAGTLETYQDLHSLDDRVQLTRERTRLSSLSKVKGEPYKRRAGNEFHVMHLVALADSNRVGLTNKRNCLVGCSKLNAKLGNGMTYSKGKEGIHYIKRDSLDSRWLFTGSDTSKLLALMIEYFGKKEMTEWLKTYKFQRTKPDNKDERPVRESDSLLEVGLIGLIGESSELSTELFIELHYHWTSYVLNKKVNMIPLYRKITDFSKHEELKPVANKLMLSLATGNDEHLVEAIEILKNLSRVEMAL